MIMAPENSQPTELINGNGDFNELGFKDFIRGAAASIPVIAIIGPQSSGKSTLLNHLFRTNFREMNAIYGRSKTTNGIWIAKAPHIEPLTVVLDLGGTDGKEKGEDDTAFEKQSALFAIAIAHTVIINMWCSDVGREHAANRPLLKIVFEALLSLLAPQKTTLHFVVRDGNNIGIPSELLKCNLKEDIEKIWEAVPKPPGNEGTLLTEIFNVEVTVLSHYIYMRHEFDEEVVQLQKQLISHNLDLSTSKISLSSAKKTWDIIKEIKGFKAPRNYRLMVATMRCEEIAMDKLRLFQSDQEWLEIEKSAKTKLVIDFGAKTKSILAKYLSEYDKETMNFESSTIGGYDQQVHKVRSSKRQDLTVKALKTLQSFTTQLKARIQNFSLSAFESYRTCYDSCVLQFDLQCSEYATIEEANWKEEASTVREQLLHEIRNCTLNQLRPMELINGDGDFNESGFEDFIRGAAASIPVIAIVGPQSSGKSTLLNHLFGTNFREMNAGTGRSKTTNGIWIAKAPDIEPLTVVLDLEGTDGKEKGEDDTAFEKQSALFAIAIAHTVIINMWFCEIGREQAANRPLLKTVFEAMLPLLSPQKTNLHFVVRDGNNTGTPSELLKCNLKDDIEKIWEAVPKPPDNEGTLLTDIFNVEVTVLSHYNYMRREFDEEVVQLQKQLISHNLDPSTSKLSLSSAKKYWDDIEKYKGFKVPPYRLMFATTRCDEIAVEKLNLFQANQAWLELEENAKTQLVKYFGAQTNSILTTYLSDYDKETINFESGTKGGYDQQVHKVRSNKRQDLTVKALKVVYPAYMNTLGHLRSVTLRSFTTQLETRRKEFSLPAFQSFQTCYDSCVMQFDQHCSESATIEHAQWGDDASSVRKQLLREIKEHALNQLREELSISVTTKVLNVVKDCSVMDIWSCIRSYMESENETAKLAAAGISAAENEQIVKSENEAAKLAVVSKFAAENEQNVRSENETAKLAVVSKFAAENEQIVKSENFATENEQIVTDLEKHARDRVVSCFKDEAPYVDKLLSQRYVHALAPRDDNTMPTKEEAYRQCIDILSEMAVIRLDDTYDVVQRVLRSELPIDANSGDGISLSSRTWENVPPQMTVITPLRCKEIWTKFKQEMDDRYSIAEKFEEEDRFSIAEKFEESQQLSGTVTRKRSLPKWVISVRKWAIYGLSIVGVAPFKILLYRFPKLVYKLAKAIGIARGMVAVLGNGRYMYSATEEELKEDDIPSRHPRLMEALQEHLNTTYKCLTTGQGILSLTAPVAA
ncbi:protein ROOT HAIR DEFECTIVE 3 homolog 2-like isoform X2 [Salvia hispanica]|uniref:protein ROOT HAIR DEFECTIVE 3 homolog 2-like isoform X2 n=1 Tax=Salvia hispanica TaxID=49212 RepID=UPI002008F95E|nr:protein ROOT HAIR DEFECTIVE 3 homolog 2-like isoform X2 [Salvia hispanica]